MATLSNRPRWTILVLDLVAAKWSTHGVMTNWDVADRRATKWNKYFQAIGRFNTVAYVVPLQPATADGREAAWPSPATPTTKLEAQR